MLTAGFVKQLKQFGSRNQMFYLVYNSVLFASFHCGRVNFGLEKKTVWLNIDNIKVY